MAFLDEIIPQKLDEARLLRDFSEDPLPDIVRKRRSLIDAVNSPWMSFICEIKRASPSEGRLAEVDAAKTALMYESSGASAISVLTDERHFGGSIQDLIDVKESVEIPVLRKDFIVHVKQMAEALHYGADAVLLIVALLGDRTKDFVEHAHSAGLECLVEVHEEGELKHALDSEARLIGINNRDLRTMRIDLGTTERIAKMVPKDRLIVAESGIASRQDVERMGKAGADAVLVGSSLMKSANISQKLKELGL